MKKGLLQVTAYNVFNKFEYLNNFKRLLLLILLNAQVFTFGTRCTPLIANTHLLIQLIESIKLNLITWQMRGTILWIDSKTVFLVHIKNIFTIKNNQTKHYNFKASNKYQILAGVKT